MNTLLLQVLESQFAFLSSKSRLPFPIAVFFLMELPVDPSSKTIPYRGFLLSVLSRIVLSSEPGSTKIPNAPLPLTTLFLILFSPEPDK